MRIIEKVIQNPGNTEMHITSAARLRLTPHTTTKESLIDRWMNDNSCLTTNPYHSILPFDDQYTDSTIHRWQASDLQKDNRSS